MGRKRMNKEYVAGMERILDRDKQREAEMRRMGIKRDSKSKMNGDR